MKSGAARRVVQAITILPLAVCFVAGYLGLRALVWGINSQIAVMIESGIVLSVVVGGALAVAYVLTGTLLWRLFHIDWLSIQFGAVVGALLYGVYNAITPLTLYSVGETPLRRALQGGFDGLLIGTIFGAIVMIISGRRLYPDRFGIQRYLILFVGVLLVAWIVLLVEGMIHLPDAAGLLLALPLLALLKLGVRRLDGGSSASEQWYDDYGYDEGE